MTPIRGFQNTPVSKAICVVTIVSAILLSITELKPYVILALDPLIVVYNQYWRLAVYQLVVINESDFVVVLVLWFMFKNLERFYGSRKYLSLIALFWLYNALLNFVVMAVGQLTMYGLGYVLLKLWGAKDSHVEYSPTIFNQVAPGPLGIISSLYVAYGKFIPVSYYFQILFSLPLRKSSSNGEEGATTGSPEIQVEEESGSLEREGQKQSKTRQITLTNQFHIHVIYTLLLLNNGFQSIIPCVVGLLIGKLHTLDILPGSKNWLIPSAIFELFIKPMKFVTIVLNGTGSIRRRRTGYQAVPTSGGETQAQGDTGNTSATATGSVAGGTVDDDANDLEDDFDEERQRALQIRAETPIRPLGSQFLDTLRGQ